MENGRWTTVSRGLDDILVQTMAVAADRTMFIGTSGKGILRYNLRDAHGTPWERLTAGLKDHEGLRENFIPVLAVDPDQALYSGTFNGGVFKSQDGGMSWRPISRALPNDSIRAIVPSQDGIVVATGRGIFRGDGRGGAWTPINEGLTELSVQALVAGPEGTLYAGTSAGAFRSEDRGQTWTAMSEGLEGGMVSPFSQFFR